MSSVAGSIIISKQERDGKKAIERESERSTVWCVLTPSPTLLAWPGPGSAPDSDPSEVITPPINSRLASLSMQIEEGDGENFLQQTHTIDTSVVLEHSDSTKVYHNLT